MGLRETVKRLEGRVQILWDDIFPISARVDVNRSILTAQRRRSRRLAERVGDLEKYKTELDDRLSSLELSNPARSLRDDEIRREVARKIRDELHLGASWSEFRDWIGREFLGE